jgi:hypothetical protein
VDFIKQFTPYAWNLRSAPILSAQIYSNLASCICALGSSYCIFSQLWVRSTLYAVRQLLWNPQLVRVDNKKPSKPKYLNIVVEHKNSLVVNICVEWVFLVFIVYLDLIIT